MHQLHGKFNDVKTYITANKLQNKTTFFTYWMPKKIINLIVPQEKFYNFIRVEIL